MFDRQETITQRKCKQENPMQNCIIVHCEVVIQHHESSLLSLTVSVVVLSLIVVIL